jgi:transposase
MLNNNACPHTATATQDLMTPFGWELFVHPPYSPDLAPSDFHVFLHLKLSFMAGGSTRTKKPLTMVSIAGGIIL